MPAPRPPRPRRRPWPPVTSSTYTRVEVLLGIISLVVGLLALLYLFPERWWTDQRFAIPQRWAFSEEVMLVGLDERYAERFGDGPTSTGYLAAVVRGSLRFEPTAIALDFRINEAESGSPGMDSLAAAVREAGARGIPVVIPTRLATWQANTEVVRRPPAELVGQVVGGYVGWVMPSGGPGSLPAPRDFPVATRLTPSCHALSLPVAAVAAHRRLLSPGGECFGFGTLADTALRRILPGVGIRDGQMRRPLYFAGPVRRTPRMRFYSSEHLIEDAATGSIDDGSRKRLILVAALYPHPSGEDAVSTPFGPERGGLIHLYAIDTLLRDGLPRRGGAVLTAFLSLLAFCGILAGWHRRALRACLPGLLVLVAYVLFAFVLFGGTTFLLPIALPVWAGLAATALGFIAYGEPPPDPPNAGDPRPDDSPPPVAQLVPIPAPAATEPALAAPRGRSRSGLAIVGAFWAVLLLLSRRKRR